MTTTTTAPAVRYLSVTDTAKAVRAALKAALTIFTERFAVFGLFPAASSVSR